MIVVGKNLKELVDQFKICPESGFDETGLSIRLSNKIILPIHSKFGDTILYNVTNVESFFEEIVIESGVLSLNPGGIALCCSQETFNMPTNYFGLVQTKGSLARLFVTTNVTDSQVDPGYKGKVTLEIMNYSPFKIDIPIDSIVAKMYIFRCTTNAEAYNGRYQNSDKPTISKSDTN